MLLHVQMNEPWNDSQGYYKAYTLGNKPPNKLWRIAPLKIQTNGGTVPEAPTEGGAHLMRLEQNPDICGLAYGAYMAMGTAAL
jgi:hypothetical protein